MGFAGDFARSGLFKDVVGLTQLISNQRAQTEDLRLKQEEEARKKRIFENQQEELEKKKAEDNEIIFVNSAIRNAFPNITPGQEEGMIDYLKQNGINKDPNTGRLYGTRRQFRRWLEQADNDIRFQKHEILRGISDYNNAIRQEKNRLLELKKPEDIQASKAQLGKLQTNLDALNTQLIGLDDKVQGRIAEEKAKREGKPTDYEQKYQDRIFEESVSKGESPTKSIAKAIGELNKLTNPDKTEKPTMSDVKAGFGMEMQALKGEIMLDLINSPDEQDKLVNQPNENLLSYLLTRGLKSLPAEKKDDYIKRTKDIYKKWGVVTDSIMGRKGVKLPDQYGFTKDEERDVNGKKWKYMGNNRWKQTK